MNKRRRWKAKARRDARKRYFREGWHLWDPMPPGEWIQTRTRGILRVGDPRAPKLPIVSERWDDDGASSPRTFLVPRHSAYEARGGWNKVNVGFTSGTDNSTG